MITELRRLARRLPKPVLFGIFGAIGCLFAALIGELLISRGDSLAPAQDTPHSVCLLIDCSGSMRGQKIEEVKAAAIRFIDNIEDPNVKVSLVSFGSNALLLSPLTGNKSVLRNSIKQLTDGGSTRLDLGLETAAESLARTTGKHTILVFTDGAADDPAMAAQVGNAVLTSGITIVAIGTDDAISDFLSVLTSDPLLVLKTNTGNFGIAFEKAGKIIFGRELMAGSKGADSLAVALMRTCLWTAIIAVLLSLFLLLGQSFYVGKALTADKQMLIAVIGGLLSGCVSGSVAQALYFPLADMGAFAGIAKVAGWGILGAILGLGLTFFVPNLPRSKGVTGGLIGGLIGGMIFLVSGYIAEDAVARLLGAPALGFCIGLMLAIAESFARKAWLEVFFAPGERIIVNLGPEPVSVGGNIELCTVYVRGAAPVEAEYTLTGGSVKLYDKIASKDEAVFFGHTRMFANVKVVVCGSQSIPVDGAASEGEARSSCLFLYTGSKKIPLMVESVLKEGDVQGLSALSGSGPVAVVTQNPSDPTMLGIKNLSQRTWIATIPSAGKKNIEAGMSVRLVQGLQIDFGLASGEVR